MAAMASRPCEGRGETWSRAPWSAVEYKLVCASCVRTVCMCLLLAACPQVFRRCATAHGAVSVYKPRRHGFKQQGSVHVRTNASTNVLVAPCMPRPNSQGTIRGGRCLVSLA